MVKTVALDFDGVIHKYSKGWLDGSIYDEPIPGAVEAVQELMKHFAVFIHTTRDPAQVAAWLSDLGFYTLIDVEGPNHRRQFWNELGILLITDRKLPAVAYVDDRAVTFTDWEQALAVLTELF